MASGRKIAETSIPCQEQESLDPVVIRQGLFPSILTPTS